MATPPIPPRPVSYVSSAADDEDQLKENEYLTKRLEKPLPAKKPIPAKKPSLPTAKEIADSPPPKPLRKSQSLAREQSDHAAVTGVPPKPSRPRSTYNEPDKSAVPPRPTRPPGIKPPIHKPTDVAGKESSSKLSSEPAATRPTITVISAKPMIPNFIPPPQSKDDVATKEKPNKPAKPTRPPQIKLKDDEGKASSDTIEGSKSGAKLSFTSERPLIKKRTSHDSIPKSNVKLTSSEPVPQQDTAKVKDSKKPAPPRPSYSIDAAKKYKGSLEEPSLHLDSEDQQIHKPVAHSRTSLQREKTLTDQDVSTNDKSDSKELAGNLPTARPRAHLEDAKQRPPKPVPPKLPHPKPVPVKSHKFVSVPDDNRKQENFPSENLQQSAILVSQINKNVDSTTAKSEYEPSNSDDDMQSELRVVGKPDSVSDYSSTQDIATDILESRRPTISKRSSSKKWKPPIAKKQDEAAGNDVNVLTERNKTQIENSSNDMPPPRPLPPKDDADSDEGASYIKTTENSVPTKQLESTLSSKKLDDRTVEEMLPVEIQKPLPPQLKKPLPSQGTKASPSQAIKLSPLEVEEPVSSYAEKEDHDKKYKPPRPAVPSVPHIKKVSDLESHSVDEPPPLPKRPTPGHPLYRYITNKPRGSAKFDYNSEDIQELSFLKDNLIELIERVDENWLYGCNVDDDCKEGMVLEKYLKIIKRLPGEDKLSYLKELPSAVAMFDFEGEDEDELSFVAGDLIILEERIDEVWLKGYLRSPEESGIFPAEFVEVVEPLPSTSESASISKSQQLQSSVTPDYSIDVESITIGDEPYCIVKNQFISEGPDELSIEPGHKVMLLDRVNEDWLKGAIDQNIGIFPSAFVDIKIDLPMPSNQQADDGSIQTSIPVEDAKKSQKLAKKPSGKCKVVFEFVAEQEGELSLHVGDIIIITAWVNDEWLQGTFNNQEGIFPVQFVHILDDLPKDSTLISDKIPKNISTETDLSPRAKASKDHITSNSDELNFKVGDVIYLLNKVDDGKFLEGELNNKVGKFPSSCVEIIVPLP